MFVDFNPDSKKIENSKKNKKSKKASKSFLESLFGAESKNVEEDFEKLIEEVDKYGEELKKDRNFFAFEKYKRSVKKLISKITEHNSVVKKSTGKNILGQKQLYVIKSLNEELSNMTRQLIEKQDVLYVINKMDDVRGMLIDVYTE